MQISRSQLLSRLDSMGYMPRWGVLLLDIVLSSIAWGICFFLGENVFMSQAHTLLIPEWEQLVCVLGVQIVFFFLFRTYMGILRYSTFVDTLKVLVADFATVATLLIVNSIVYSAVGDKVFLNTQLLTYFFISFTLLFSLRIVIKLAYDQLMLYSHRSKRVLIYGTKQAGVAIAKMLKNSSNIGFHPVGFLDDAQYKGSSHDLMGLRIYYTGDKLAEDIEHLRVDGVIISPLKIKDPLAKKTLRFLVDHSISVYTTPAFTEWDKIDSIAPNKAATIGRIESIRVEDLLERPTIEIDDKNVHKMLNNKVVMVTGAAGSIGSELVRQILSHQPNTLVMFEQAESPLHELRMDVQNKFPDQHILSIIGDVRNRERVEEIMARTHPQVIFHAAAYKHVPLMEDFPTEAIQANVLGTKNVADMAVKYGVERFIMISTDKAVNPTNIMGASKRIAEIYVQSLNKKLQQTDPNCTKFITTRFGNVLGSNGSVIPYFKKQIAEGGPVTVTHPDIIRYFMTIPEACSLVLEACTLGQGGEIFVFDMGRPVKIATLAENMIRLAGYTPGKEIEIRFTGLRPGEKLYEELLNQAETTLPTPNQKIMIAKVREFAFDEVSTKVESLIESTKEAKPFTTVSIMKEIVPEFISNNSVFEKLDGSKK